MESPTGLGRKKSQHGSKKSALVVGRSRAPLQAKTQGAAADAHHGPRTRFSLSLQPRSVDWSGNRMLCRRDHVSCKFQPYPCRVDCRVQPDRRGWFRWWVRLRAEVLSERLELPGLQRNKFRPRSVSAPVVDSSLCIGCDAKSCTYGNNESGIETKVSDSRVETVLSPREI